MAFYNHRVSNRHSQQTRTGRRLENTAPLQPPDRPDTTVILGSERFSHLAMAQEEPCLRSVVPKTTQPEPHIGKTGHGDDTFAVSHHTADSIHPKQRRILLLSQLQIMQQSRHLRRTERSHRPSSIRQYDALDDFRWPQ